MAGTQRLTDEQRKLVEENMGIVGDVVKHTVHYLCSNETYEDFYQIGYLALCRAAQKYQGDKNAQFQTYAYNAIWNAFTETFSHDSVVDYYEPPHERSGNPCADRERDDGDMPVLEKANRTKHTDSHLSSDEDIDLRITIKTALEKLQTELSPKAYSYVEQFLLYANGMDMHDIAAKYDICYGTARTNINRGRKILQKERAFRGLLKDSRQKEAAVG